MKSCPDIDRLLELTGGGSDDLEVRAHVQQCRKCRGALLLLREIPAAMRPEVEVPEPWIRRAAALARRPEGAAAARARVPAALGAALLGASTTAVTLAMTGAAGTGRPLDFFLFCVAGGMAAGLFEVRVEAGERRIAAEMS